MMQLGKGMMHARPFDWEKHKRRKNNVGVHIQARLDGFPKRTQCRKSKGLERNLNHGTWDKISEKEV